MLRKNDAIISMLNYLQIIWLLPLFLISSCSGTPVVKGVPGEQSGIVKVESENKTQTQFPFILGPRDEIMINVWRNDDFKRTVPIDPSGNIQMPLIGEVKASGLTIGQLKEKITVLLSKYIIDPQVDISVSTFKNLKVYVLGEVKSPGTFEWRNNMLVWEGISLASGYTADANQKNILVVRNENGKTAIKALNLHSILKGESLDQDVYLRNGDVVYVLPTFIANVEKFMTRFSNIIAPLINLEGGIALYPQVKNVLQGKELSGTVIVPTQ